MEKLNALSLPEKLIAGGGILMLIASFLPWYKISFDLGEFGGGSISASGWDAPGAIWSILATLIAVILAGSIIAMRFSTMKMPELPQGVSWGKVFAGGAALIVVCILLKLLGESSYMSFGFFLGIIAAAAIAAGGFMLFQAEKAGVSQA